MSKLKVLIVLIIIILLLIISSILVYNYEISAVSKDSFEVTLDIDSGSTYYSISSLLKENDLIKSELFYKIYIKLNNPSNLQKGKYVLNKNMSIKDIINKFEMGDAKIDTSLLVIPEGKHITDVAISLSAITNYSEADWLNFWNSSDFINKVIDKYWFITDEVLNSNLKYHLEGYFFPATYQILKSSTMEEITYKMLDKMDEVLSKYKNDINNGLTIHQILTLASIVEYEAKLDEDRPVVAKVFLNRLSLGMKLQSCATVGYAIGNWKLSYTTSDLNVDSPYNTYMYYGLPVGPASLAGEASISAVIYPSNDNYLYFLANVFNENESKTYFSYTYSEHQSKCLLYLGKSC